MVLDLFETGLKIFSSAVLVIVPITLVRMKDGTGFRSIMNPPEMAGVFAFHRYKVR